MYNVLAIGGATASMNQTSLCTHSCSLVESTENRW